ncbi:MAG: FliA/WhiG family RNA polymerase sigma factor [Chloroflexi bacterium]|nr:FliA/WhiG family RNA polymerase sigma factor [Chloroflexota bacterium]
MTATMTVAEAWKSYLEHGDAASRDQIIIQHTPLVKYVIGRLAIHLPQVLDFEDLLGYGTLGLIQAFERFDPGRGVKFESYAVMRIRGAILDALRSLRGLPQSVTDKAKRLQRAAIELETTLGRPPTDDELAMALNISTDQLNQQMVDASWVTVSLDNIMDNQGDGDIRALTSHRSEDDVSGMVERREMVSELSEALATLSERERLILSLYYQDELTMREIGQVLDVSEGRVCQLHARALHKLRVAMGHRTPEFFSRKWGNAA